ncbi:MAG: hypothetical protein ABI890_16275 [Lapillicoccus sp.]
MRRPMLIAVGILLVLIGALWTLQGLGYVGGSAMTGQTLWAVVGPVVVIVGAVLGWRGLGSRGVRGGPTPPA